MKLLNQTINNYLKLFLCVVLLHTLYNCSSSDTDTMEDIILDNPDSDPVVPEIPCNSGEIFANESTNAVCFEIEGHVRKVYTNNFPAHQYGPWGGPNILKAQDFEYSMCLYPELTNTITEIKEDPNSQSCGAGIIFGVSNQGINYSPFARLYWVNPNTQEENLNWHIEADFTLSMDLNGGHVNSVSRYHYHNIPTNYFTNDLKINGNAHSPIIGYAADGFPIYYKYLNTDSDGSSEHISSFSSGYELKSGNRPGNGVEAPNGSYNGTYIEDYEYAGGDLDECGGRYGVTPEYPNGTYYYVLTDNWPYIPRCFKGKYVDNSFKISPGCPDSTATQDCSTEAIASNADMYQQLKELNLKLYHKFNQLDMEEKYQQSEIAQIKVFKEDGSLIFTTNTSGNRGVQTQLKSGVCYVQIDFYNGQITRKVTI